MDAFAGIDVGSLSTDCVIIDDREEILSYSITETGANSTEAAEKSFEEALVRAAVERNRIKRIVATGYGRISVPFADTKVTEISCHALGASKLFPDTGTVVDIGGQDSKVIRVGPGGKVLGLPYRPRIAGRSLWLTSFSSPGNRLFSITGGVSIRCIFIFLK